MLGFIVFVGVCIFLIALTVGLFIGIGGAETIPFEQMIEQSKKRKTNEAQAAKDKAE
jgi:hypothetical protein